MVHKRPFGDDNSLDVVCKYARQGDHPGQLGSTFPSSDAPHEGQASGADFCTKLQDAGGLGSASVPTISNGNDWEFENSSSACIPHFFLVNSRVPKSDAALRPSFFPEFLEHGHKLRALIQSDEIFSSVIDYPHQISIGPENQAYVPEWRSQGWTSSSDKLDGSDPQGPVAQALHNDDDDGSMEKLMGTCIIPMPELEAPATCYSQDGETKSDCTCTDRGSIICVRRHVVEARHKLRENLGSEIFEELGFCDMGEEVAKKWTEEEEERFHEVVLSNPESLGKNFWDHFSAVFPSQTKKDIVSYYFNVFMLRIRAEQNQFDPQNIDSDNDEWQLSVAGVMEEDEDSVVESPTIQGSPAHLQDPAVHCHGKFEDENENETSNDGADIFSHRIAYEEDYKGDVEDISVSHIVVSAHDGGDDGCQHFGNLKLKRSNDKTNYTEDDSCTLFEFQQDKVDCCGGPDMGTDRKQFNQE